MLVPATRPCLLACVPRATTTDRPVMRWRDCDAVTGGPDVRVSGAQVVVDDDAAGLAHADARGPGKVRVRAHPEPDHHEVGRHRTRLGLHGGDPSADTW